MLRRTAKRSISRIPSQKEGAAWQSTVPADHRRSDAERYTADKSDERGDEGEISRGGRAVQDERTHGIAGASRAPEISVHDTDKVDAILNR
jgi:hypothetical protein